MRLLSRPAVLAALVAAGISAAVSPASASAVAAPHTAGSRVWLARYGTGGAGQQPSSEAVSPNGSAVYVSGLAQRTSGEPEYATVAYNAATGAQTWVATFPTRTALSPSVTVSPDGSEVFVTGAVHIAGHYNFGLITLAYNAATGAELWKYQPTMQDFGTPGGLAVSSDGSTVYVMGWETAFPGRTEYVTALDTATGAPLWTGSYTFQKDLANFHEYGLALSPNGAEVLVTGSAGLVAFSTSGGAELWADGYSRSAQAAGLSVAVSPDSSTVFVTGMNDRVSQDAYWTSAYNAATGARIWSTLYPGLGDSVATSIGVSPSGSAVFVTGTSEGSAHSVMKTVTIAYNPATGARLWLASYTNERPEITQVSRPQLAVTPDSSTVTVTGARARYGHQAGYVTLAYNASTGAQQLAATYHAPADNLASVPTAIAVSPDSSTAFVTGWSEYSPVTSDPEVFLTIAYRL